ncbi:MAG: polysaccharide biosynthesis tyrosine autokinase [Epsilonproteobacteria bacterium]|nr:polysaccharide biosynthesis tyrosine autokinase [Campylobacterota bacterium]
MTVEFEGNSLSFKKIITAFFKYKWINLFLIIVSVCLGLFYYYLAQPQYESKATLEISTNPQENRVDFFGNAIGRAHGTETEIDILKSEFLLKKTLQSVDRSVDYYKKVNLKKTMLYQETPFQVSNVVVKDDKVFGSAFIVKYVDKLHYEIALKNSLLAEMAKNIPQSLKPKKLATSKRYTFRYGERVSLPHCSFVIHKKGKFQRAEYGFVLNAYDEVLQKIRQSLSIKPASFKSSVLKVTYKDTIAKRAKDFLNAYVLNYLQYSKRNMVENDAKTLDFITEQLGQISGKLENSEDSLQGYKRTHNISDLAAQKKQTVEKLNDFQENLKIAEMDLSVVEKLYISVKRGNYNAITSVATNYPVLNSLLQNLEDAKMEKKKKLVVFTANHPDVVSVMGSIENMEKAIEDIAKGILDKAKSQVYLLKKVVNEYTQRLKELPKLETELVKHERLFTVNDKVYNYLLQKQSELSIEKAANSLNKKVLDYAKEPRRPLSPKLGSILSISLFLGLVLALLHTLLRVKYDTKIKDRYDIHTLTDLPLFGMIPFVKNAQKYNTAYVLDEPNSAASESFRSIKNNLEYAVTKSRCKVILVTSTVPNEGKTTISANLSAVLGMGEKKSIILSLDLRRPELHHKFMLSNKLGMSDVLSNKVDLKTVTWENENYRNFNIVTSGGIPPNPAELLASSQMEEVIETLKSEYDYIVLDTPPFEYVSDALSLMKFADVTLFVVKSEFSEAKYIKDIDKLVERVGIENAGIILNSVKAKHYVNKKFDYKYIYHEA